MKSRGFTLPEYVFIALVLVVLAISGIRKYIAFQEFTRTRACQLNIAAIENAVVEWNKKNSNFPAGQQGCFVLGMKTGVISHHSGSTHTIEDRPGTAIATALTDPHFFVCPTVLKDYLGGDATAANPNYSDAASGFPGPCPPKGNTRIRGQYAYYWSGPKCGPKNHNKEPGWFQVHPEEANQVGWCAPWGAYGCNGPAGDAKSRHAYRW